MPHCPTPPDQSDGRTAYRVLVNVEYKIAAAFVLAFFAIILVGGATYYNANTLLKRNEWVVHTYKVLGVIDDVFDSIDEMESGGRGYLLTGRTEYLQPYESGLNAIGPHLDELQKSTADNPIQQRHVENIRTYVNRSIDALHERVDVRQRGGREAVLPLLGVQAKENMDQLRFLIAAMKNQENQLLEVRTVESRQSAHRTLTNFVLMLVLAVMLLGAFFVFIRHDLAERRNTDEALRQSDKKFRGVMDSAPDAMIIADSKGEIQIVNTQAERLFGYAREEFDDRNLSTLLLRHEETGESRDEGLGALEPSLHDLESLASHVSGVRKGGDLFPIDISTSALEIGGELLQISSIRDRTERQRAEDALTKYSVELARSNAELERFAYVASHDLQEPLRMVSSYTQLLSKRYKGKLDTAADEFIAYAVDGATRMQKLINDLLALSRIGTQARPSEPVDTGAVLERVLSDLKPALEAAAATVDFPVAMPTVLADGTQVGQLFQNLVGNAIKFHGTEAPIVQIRVALDEDGLWRFAFTDNGIGIEPQYFERIFVIFQRLHGKESYPGTGIGLAICKKIVERHGGRLWVESAEGQGSSFFFTLPPGA